MGPMAAQDPRRLTRSRAVGRLQVSQVVDPLKTARFALPKSIIARLSRGLV